MARTPLHMFGMEYRVQEYEDLVASGDYDVNAQDADGLTPLHYAAEQKRVELICCLLDAGANPNIPDVLHGNTPLWRAIFNVDETGMGVEQMLRQGGDPTIANKHGVTPLEIARTSSRSANQRLLPLLEETAARITRQGQK